MLDRVRIILTRPIRSGNVGAVCRAMMNMGLSDLVIVAPDCDLLDAQAQGFAARAKPLLRSARVVETLDEALADCVLALATSAKRGLYRRQAAIAPDDAADLAVQTATRGPVAIAFGPEDRGLVLNELLAFDRVIEIPGDDDYPVMNLAAAAAVICYEIRRAWLQASGQPAISECDEPLATADRKQVLFAKLFDALEQVGFFQWQQRPEHLRFALRRIFGRVDLTVNEIDVLIGMAGQIRFYTDRHPPTEPDAPTEHDDQ